MLVRLKNCPTAESIRSWVFSTFNWQILPVFIIIIIIVDALLIVFYFSEMFLIQINFSYLN